jgi:hypothetical protein
MTQITVSITGARGLKAALHGLASAITIGYVAWHGGDAPLDALGLALVAGYGSFTTFRLGAHTPDIGARRGKERRRG